MPTIKHTVEWEQYVANLIYNNAGNFYLCLMNGASAIPSTGLAPKQNFFAAELTDAAYSRVAGGFGTDAYDSGNNRWNEALNNMLFQPTASLQYDMAFLVAGASATNSKTATANSGTGQITATGHGLTNGDQVLITADSGGSLPTGLAANTIAYAQVVDANNIKLYSNSSLTTQITFSSNGSSLRLRYANGTVVLWRREDSVLTIATNQAYTFNGNVAVFNAGYIAGT